MTPPAARLRPALAVLAAALSAASCAHGHAVAPAAPPASATLEVVNRTSEEQVVSVRGRVEATLAPGTRQKLRWLTPGPASLEAWAAVGGEALTARTATARLELIGGQVVLWELPGDAPAPAALADLTVESALRRDVTLTLDGTELGALLAGDVRTFRDLPAGEHTVRALDAGRLVVAERTLGLPGDGEARWRIQQPTGVVTVLNDGIAPVDLALDGAPRGRLEPGEQVLLDDVAAGPHELVAAPIGRGTAVRHAFELVADVPHVWTLSDDRAAVEVVNRTAEALLLAPPGGGEPLRISPGASRPLPDLAPGVVILRATGAETGLPYAVRMHLDPRQSARWEVAPPRETVRVENATARPVDLVAAGTRRGTLAPGQTRIVADLPEGEVELAAVAQDGTAVGRRTVTLAGGRAATWRVEDRVGALDVVNQRPEPVVVFVDARRLGEVPASGRVAFTGVGAGARLVEALNARSEKVARATIEVTEGAAAPWTVEDPRATLVVTNASGEALLTEGSLAEQQPRVEPGQRVLYRLPAGPRRLEVRGEASGTLWESRIVLPQGDVVEWTVASRAGRVELVNGQGEPVRWSLDRGEPATLAPGATAALDDVQPGTHEVRAIGARSGEVWTRRLSVPPDGLARWELAPHDARLLVSNAASEPVTLEVDGRPHGRVEAGETKGFGAIAPGRRRVTATGLRTGWTWPVEVELRQGETQLLDVRAPRAVLLVDNGSGEAVRIAVDGEPVGEVPAGAATTALDVPSGQRSVVAEGVRTGVATTWRLALGPRVAVRLAVPAPAARLVVVNRTADEATVRLGDREAGRVAAGDSLVVEDVAPGTYWLEARAGALLLRERREVEAGETATWVLPPAASAPPAPGEGGVTPGDAPAGGDGAAGPAPAR